MLQKLALAVLRLTYGDAMQRTLPPESAAAATRSGGWRRLVRPIVRAGGRLISGRNKARLQDMLITRFRIPVDLVPAGELEELYHEALGQLVALDGEKEIGDYLEFGVYQGTSLACMHRALARRGLKQPRLFGFDSFQGLPPEDTAEGGWFPGQFRSSEDFTRARLSEAGVDWARTQLIPGFFSDSLTPELYGRLGLKRASVIMIDCDLYGSARDALAFCAPLIGEHAVIVFDDWQSTDAASGEQRAFDEFLGMERDLRPQFLGKYGKGSRAFLVSRVAKPEATAVPTGRSRWLGVTLLGGPLQEVVAQFAPLMV